METNIIIVLLVSSCAGIVLQSIGARLSQRPIGIGNAKSSLFSTIVLYSIIAILMLVLQRFVPTPWSYPFWFILCLWAAAAGAALPGILWDIVRGR